MDDSDHPADEAFTLLELAAAAGMTPRNVRAYQTRGLLRPPERTGRASVYRREHLERLLEVRRLHDAGLPLRLLSNAEPAGLIAATLALSRGPSESGPPQGISPHDDPRTDEAPVGRIPSQASTVDEVDALVVERLRQRDPGLPERLIALGVLHAVDEGIYASADLNRSVNDLQPGGLAERTGLAVIIGMAEASMSVAAAVGAELDDSPLPADLVEPLTMLGTTIAHDVLRHALISR